MEQLAIEAANWIRQGYLHRAAACHIQRVNSFRQQTESVNLAAALVQLGRVYDMLGNVDEAIEAYEQGLALSRLPGERSMEGRALVALGIAYGHLGYALRTKAFGERGLLIARETGNWQDELVALESLGHAHLWLDERELALNCYQQGLSIAIDMKAAYEQGTLLEGMGLAYIESDNGERAIDCYEQGISLCNSVNALYSRGRLLAHLGDAYARNHRSVEAAHVLSQARLIFHKVHMYRGFTLLTHYTANLTRQLDQFEEARRCYQRAIKLFDDVQDRYGQARCLLDYAQLLQNHEKELEARKIVGSVLAIYRERGTEEQVRKMQKWLEGE